MFMYLRLAQMAFHTLLVCLRPKTYISTCYIVVAVAYVQGQNHM